MVTYPGERQPTSVPVCYCAASMLLSMLATRNNLTRGFHAARDKQSVVHTTTVLRIGMRVCGVAVPNAGPTKQSCTPEQDDEKQLLTNDTSHYLGTSTGHYLKSIHAFKDMWHTAGSPNDHGAVVVVAVELFKRDFCYAPSFLKKQS